MKQELIYKDESYEIVGACFEVYKTMGCGFLESVYQECLEKEFIHRCLPFESQKEIEIAYKGETLLHKFKPDFVCYEKIIVEIKAVSKLVDEHRAQILNYLNATQYKLGLLVNFGHYPKLEKERFIFDRKEILPMEHTKRH
jgi:GxxExxY protein